MAFSLPARLDGWPLELVEQRLSEQHHGDWPKWHSALDSLPSMDVTASDYGHVVQAFGDCDQQLLLDVLQQFHPWRKGPFQIGPVLIDSEWRSDMKWARLEPHLCVAKHRVLDIGCGNGYFGWRLLAAGADEVIGVDPTILFCAQHLAIQRYLANPRNWVLPLKGEELPTIVQFGTVMSMGVLYHRRDPVAHLAHLFALTEPGGQVVLETLIHPGDTSLVPNSRYARMRNVWRVPCVDDVHRELQQVGFEDIELIDSSETTSKEQRQTEWMRFESLAHALDPHDATLTVEGLPAPIRGMWLARKPATSR